MMPIAFFIALALSPVRAEPVEALPFLTDEKNSPSTSSGRTEVGPQTAIDAERAFAADAKAIGQWTAFRKWSTDDAVMFVPQPTNAHAFLKDRKDPPKAIDWWPTASYISCDGKLAVNTGGWKRPDGSVGYFSTVWQRQADGGWKWIVDGGDGLSKPRPRTSHLKGRRASCTGRAMPVESARSVDDIGKTNFGQTTDRTLWWKWEVGPDGRRLFSASIWNGRAFDLVIDDKIAGSPPNT